MNSIPLAPSPLLSAARISAAIRQGDFTASSFTTLCLDRIARFNPALNCFTHVSRERALARAAQVDKALRRGENPGPLAGVPFAVKNLFDITGISTLAGSKINASAAPSTSDALLIRRLEEAGAILVGALAMGEYAYDFTGENAHYGACRNPWDTSRMSGGSSSGSGTAVAAGLVPIALGSDTNGSIRVPSSLCGLFGLKPTYGRLPRTGTFPFCDSLDHLGPMARSTEDLALSFDTLQGWDSHDHACAQVAPRTTLPSLDAGIADLKIGRAEGYFDCENFPEAETAVDAVCMGLKVKSALKLAGAAEGRAAAYLITNAESANLHRHRLQNRLADFDPDTRDRFLAGNLLPATWYLRAQQVRRQWLQTMLQVFAEVDVIIAPCTPCSAPLLGSKTLLINGKEQPLRPNLGLFTQPFSAIGLPVCSVPLWLKGSSLPIGVQIVAAPWREDLCLRVARWLEHEGIAECRLPAAYA